MLGARGVSRPSAKQTSRIVTLPHKAWALFKASAAKCMTTHFREEFRRGRKYPPGGDFLPLGLLRRSGTPAPRGPPRGGRDKMHFLSSSRDLESPQNGRERERERLLARGPLVWDNAALSGETSKFSGSPPGTQGGGEFMSSPKPFYIVLPLTRPRQPR